MMEREDDEDVLFTKLNFIKRKGEDSLEISESSTPETSPSMQRRKMKPKRNIRLDKELFRMDNFPPSSYFLNSDPAFANFKREDDDGEYDQFSISCAQWNAFAEMKEGICTDLICAKQVATFEKQYFSPVMPNYFFPINDGSFALDSALQERLRIVPNLAKDGENYYDSTISSPSSVDTSPPLMPSSSSNSNRDDMETPPRSRSESLDPVLFNLVCQPDPLQRKCYEKENRYIMPNPMVVAPAQPVNQDIEGKVTVRLIGDDGIDYSDQISFSKTKGKNGQLLDPSLRAAFSIKVFCSSKEMKYYLQFEVKYRLRCTRGTSAYQTTSFQSDSFNIYCHSKKK